MNKKDFVENMLNNLNNQFNCQFLKTQLDYDMAFNVCKHWIDKYDVEQKDGE